MYTYVQQEMPKNYMVHYNNNNEPQFMYAVGPPMQQQQQRDGRARKFVMISGIAGCCVLFTGFLAFFIIILLNEQGYIR